MNVPVDQPVTAEMYSAMTAPVEEASQLRQHLEATSELLEMFDAQVGALEDLLVQLQGPRPVANRDDSPDEPGHLGCLAAHRLRFAELVTRHQGVVSQLKSLLG